MKKIEYENGAFSVEGSGRMFVQECEEGFYAWWDECNPDDTKPIVIRKQVGDFFGTGDIFRKVSDIPPRPKKLRTFEPGLYRVKGGYASNVEWEYRERTESGCSFSLNGRYENSCFDTAYSEYERAEFKPVGEE
jgi:hypothetical protein